MFLLPLSAGLLLDHSSLLRRDSYDVRPLLRRDSYYVRPFMPRMGVGADEATRDPDDPEDAPLTAEGFARIRERQRLRASGAPVSVWAKTADREVPKELRVEWKPRPPTKEEEEAANTLIESMLSEQVPDDFGEGVEDYAAGDYIRKRPKA